MSRFGAIRFVQGLKEVLVKPALIAESFAILLPGNKPKTGQIPRFRDDLGNVEWYDLNDFSNSLNTQISQSLFNLDRAIAATNERITSFNQMIAGVNASINDKENVGIAKSLIDAHTSRIDHSQFATKAELQAAMATQSSTLTIQGKIGATTDLLRVLTADGKLVLRVDYQGGVMVGCKDGKISFYGATPQGKPAINGPKSGNPALKSLIEKIASGTGLWTNSTSE